MSQPSSPSPATVGSGSFLSSISNAHPAASDTRKFLGDEMEGRFHDDPKVLDLLDMPDPNSAPWRTHVDAIHAAFAVNPLMHGDMEFLERVTDPDQSFHNREELMYKPLVRVPQ